jgi:glycosyltransferase involved in cell wall biosynthesis
MIESPSRVLVDPPSAYKVAFPRIALVGPYPPPIGGVSIHIKRFKHKLEDYGVRCSVYDLGATDNKGEPNVVPVPNFKTWLVRYAVFGKEEIVHCHTGGWSDWRFPAVMLLVKLRRRRMVYTFHSFRDSWEITGPLSRFLVRLVCRFADSFVAVTPGIRDNLIRIGVAPSRVIVIPAFLPPQPLDTEKAVVPDHVLTFVKRHKPIVVATASYIEFYHGEDMYGVDMCVDLCAALKQHYPDVGLVFYLPQISDESYFEWLQRQIEAKGISRNFLFVTADVEFYPILAFADAFVRPTNTDGDAISLREALHSGIPAIASDVVKRPAGTQLFRHRDAKDFLTTVLRELETGHAPMPQNEDGFSRLIALYWNLRTDRSESGIHSAR